MKARAARSGWAVFLLAGACASSAPGISGDSAAGNDDGGLPGAAGQGGPGGAGGLAVGDAAKSVDAAGAPDRPLVDAAMIDGGQDAGPHAACNALICEDFEKGALDKILWGTYLSGGGKNSVTVQGNIVAHGKWAMKSHAQDNSPHAFIYYKKLPAELSTHLFGRAYIYITPGYPTGHNLLGWAGDNTNFPFGDRLLEFGGNPLWSALADFDRGSIRGEKMQLNTWMCVEWEFTSLPQDVITLWVNSKQQFVLKNIGNGSPDKLTSVGLGHRSPNQGAQNPIDVYYDDVAIDAKRIGCD